MQVEQLNRLKPRYLPVHRPSFSFYFYLFLIESIVEIIPHTREMRIFKCVEYRQIK
jgi:hypothetical protein